MRYQFDQFTIDTSQYQILHNQSPVACEPKVFDVIVYLVEHRERLISRDELFEQVWLGRMVSDTSLSNHIKSARKLLGDSADEQRMIKTVRGRGYQWVMDTALQDVEQGALSISSVSDDLRDPPSDPDHTVTDDNRSFGDASTTTQPIASPSLWQLRLYRLVILGLFIGLSVLWISSPPTAENNRNMQRIAVLPFHKLGSNPKHDYLAIALADQLIGNLDRMTPLSVRATGSIRPYQNTQQSPKEIGEALQVDSLIMGSYQIINDQLQLSLELIDVDSQDLRWRKDFTAPLDRSFELQPAIAKNIARQLHLTPSPSFAHNADSFPASPLAYEYYLRALAFSDTTAEAKLAVAMLDQAKQLLPDYAPIHSELGRRSHFLALFDLAKDIDIEQAQQHYQTALAINPLSFSALNGLASIYTETGRIFEAVSLSHRLLAHNPNNAQAHFTLGYSYRYAGFTQASIEAIQTALQLQPNDRWSHNLAISYIALSAYDEALAALKKGQETPYSLGWMATIYLHQGKKDLALKQLNRAIELQPGSFWKNDSIGFRAYITGETASGLEAAHTLEAANVSDGEALFYWGCLYALLDDPVSSLRMLNKAVDHGYFNAYHFRHERFLESVRQTSAFQQLLKRVETLHEQFKQEYFTNEEQV